MQEKFPGDRLDFRRYVAVIARSKAIKYLAKILDKGVLCRYREKNYRKH